MAFLQNWENRYKDQDTQVIKECNISAESKSIVVVSLPETETRPGMQPQQNKKKNR